MRARVDDRELDELIVESQDLQVDAMRTAREARPLIVEAARAAEPVSAERLNTHRRRLLRNGGLGMGALVGRGLLGTAFGSAIVGIVAKPAAAQEDVSIQIFQTAASLENLAVATYGAALQLPFFGDNAVVQTFAETTMQQHAEHGAAFNAQARDLGGEEQTATNPKYTPVVEEMKPSLTDYAKVVELASTLEEVAQDTYLANLSLLPTGETRQLMASVMAVETQHLATLRAVGALLAADAPQLIAIPVDAGALPGAAGSVAFPAAFEEPNLASPPQEGAVR
ncbi:MAG TPA: ferritin-like domain-containing protein [Acidimicrobiales bacterium]|nr:ferritin-like domain-containing protein [Acidimicrobiales bacterium]